MGAVIIDRLHRAARAVEGAIRLVYVMTVPAGIQAVVAYAVKERR